MLDSIDPRNHPELPEHPSSNFLAHNCSEDDDELDQINPVAPKIEVGLPNLDANPEIHFSHHPRRTRQADRGED